MSRAIVLIAAVACKPDAADPADPPSAALPTCATDPEPARAAIGAAGLSAAIVRDGAVACTAVAGDADVEAARPVTADTLFAWASTSKTVTATALMVLHDDGRFDLDDDIRAYLPFPVDIPACPGAPLTFRHLLTHTSSIVDNPRVYYTSYVDGDSPVALGDFLAGYLDPEGADYDADGNFAEKCPGTSSHYSNIGAGLIGYLVEQISGEPFDAFCADRLFGPLGMDESAWHLADLDPTHVAMPYRGREDQWTALGHTGFPTYPDGLLRTSPRQLARFLAMFAGDGALDGVRVLAPETTEEMRRVQLPAVDDTQGLIWFYTTIARHPGLLGHDGEDPGTASLMFYDPDDRSGALLVANVDWWANSAAPEANALFAALLDEAATR